MSSSLAQLHRIAKLKTPLGEDVLVVTGFEAREGLSQLFNIQIDCISEQKAVDLASLIGKKASIKYAPEEPEPRYFSGLVVEARASGDGRAAPGDETARVYDYQLTVRPWTWLLSQAMDSRIFQHKTVVDIIKDVFNEAGFTDYEFKTQTSYPTLDYCVQYQETHLNFVNRLMEQEGIYYYFKHEDNSHKMIIVDNKSSHQPAEHLPKLEYGAKRTGAPTDKQYVHSWRQERKYGTGKVVVSGYDFETPPADMKENQQTVSKFEHGSMEVFTYPRKYKLSQKGDVGHRYAQVLMEMSEAFDQRRYASGTGQSLQPGFKTTLESKHKIADVGQEFLVVDATHVFESQSYMSGGQPEVESTYRGEYVLLPAKVQFRAPVVTPKPVIYGPQTALVVGPSGEEIHTDKHGRVKLQFHWDRKGKKDENSSRWVRVSQMFSGKQWGGFYIPRIGMEAVVEFIGGDPDRPIVVGTVYNGDNKMPEEMPANKTKHGMKTRSSKGGGPDNFNQLIFEDLKDKEKVFFHAEKDLESKIENQETREITGKDIGHADPAREVKIKTGSDTLTISDGDQTVDIHGKQTIKTTDDIFVESQTKITLKVGQSMIELTQGGITIKALDIKINGTSKNVTIDAAVCLQQSSALIKLN